MDKRNSIFNPKDKLSEKKKYTLDVLPYEHAHIAKSNNFKYDPIQKMWYTLDEEHILLKDYKKSYIDFNKFKKENKLVYDSENQQWFTYSSNNIFKNYFK